MKHLSLLTRALIALAVTGGVAISTADVAQADSTTFLNDVHALGLGDDDGDSGLLQTGRLVCTDLAEGMTKADIAAKFTYFSDRKQGNIGITPKQADLLVDYAADDLCPGV